MSDMQQVREETPDEKFRMLFGRVANLNDRVSALLAPAWGSEAGIIPSNHPLYMSANLTAEEQAAPVDWEAIVRDRERELKAVGEARHRAEAAVARASALADRWQAAHGSSNFLVRAAGAELRDELAGEAQRCGEECAEGHVYAGRCEQAAEHGVVYAASCSNPDHACPTCGECVNQHPGEGGCFEPEQLPPNQGPLTGIEVRDPCPHCEDCRLIPRRQMIGHIREQHPGAVCDFPLGWRVAKAYAFDEHDPKCSYTQTRGALLCDCHVLFPERRQPGQPKGA